MECEISQEAARSVVKTILVLLAVVGSIGSICFVLVSFVVAILTSLAVQLVPPVIVAVTKPVEGLNQTVEAICLLVFCVGWGSELMPCVSRLLRHYGE